MTSASVVSHYLDMPVLTGEAHENALRWIEVAAQIARSSGCARARWGCVIVSGDDILGTGANNPPGGGLPRGCAKDSLPPEFRSDRTCCLHAEQKAIMDALRRHAHLLPASTLYFVRLAKEGNIAPAAEPYCTICSKMALASGVRTFVLIHEDGIRAYSTDLYNNLSFRHAEVH